MRQFVLPLLSVILLASCGANETSSSSYEEHSYAEVSDKIITYDQGFSIDEEDHFLYFYQETCHSCEEIKDEVIDFALNVSSHFYFITATESIPHNYSYQDINKTIGSSDVNDLFVGVTPQLVVIKEGKIEKNIINPIYIETELSHYRS